MQFTQHERSTFDSGCGHDPRGVREDRFREARVTRTRCPDSQTWPPDAQLFILLLPPSLSLSHTRHNTMPPSDLRFSESPPIDRLTEEIGFPGKRKKRISHCRMTMTCSLPIPNGGQLNMTSEFKTMGQSINEERQDTGGRLHCVSVV